MDWITLRQEFPVTRRWAFLDHAAVAPLSAPARRVLGEWADDLTENGVVCEPAWLARIEEVRCRAARLLNADPLEIAFVPNTSAGIGLVAEGLDWRPGDNVVTAADEYPANLYPWMNLASRGVELRRVPSREGRILVEDLRAALDAHTRLVTLSFVEYATGFRNDLDAVSAFCRERGILFLVDAIQGLGVLPLDVRQTPLDFLAADGHKWMLGPEGAGLFYVRRELVDRLHPIGVGWNSVEDPFNFARVEFRLKPHAGRWEGGSLNAAGVVALGASLELLLNLGLEAIAERVLALTDEFCGRAERAGLEVYSSRLPAERSAIVSLRIPGDVRAAVRHCREQGIVINHRAGRLRVSPHCYTSADELGRLIEVLRAGP